MQMQAVLSFLLLFLVRQPIVLGQTIPLDSAVRTGKLDNGLIYFIRHNADPKNRVLIYLVNKVGSVLEEDNQQGLAHFMEHMNFNGTIHFPKNELIDYLQKNGVRFGADINAYTGFDETVYELPIPSDKPDVLRKGLEIVHDWAQGATLDPGEINKERGVVLEEERLGKGAGERMRRAYWPTLMEDSRYAARLPIGKDSVIKGFRPATIRRFYHDWYRPDLQAVIVVGDIDAAAMEERIRREFADLKNPRPEPARRNYAISLHGANRFVAVTDQEQPVMQAEIVIKAAALKIQTMEGYRSRLLRDLFNMMLNSRLQELARKADPPFVTSKAGIGEFMDGLDAFDASVVATQEGLELAMKALWRELVRVRRFGFMPTEVERAKKELLATYEENWKERDKTESIHFVREYQACFLKGTAAPSIEAEYDMAKSLLPDITVADINVLAARYVTDSNRTILIEGPGKEKSLLPDSATATGWLATVEMESMTPYKDQVSQAPLLLSDPTPGKIVSEKRDDALGVTIWTLSNGATVLLKPTNFKNDEILFGAFGPGGTSFYADTEFQSAANAAQLVCAGGAGRYNLTQLQKYLAGKQVALRFQMSERAAGLVGAATPTDLVTALQLLYAYWTEPRLDTAIIQGILERGRAQLSNRSSDPNSVFSDSVSAVLSNYDLRRTGPSVEKLKQINPARCFQIYKRSFSDASSFTFTFVGSLDLARLRPLAENYLATLPSTYSAQEAKDLHIHIPSGVINKTVYKGSAPKSTVLLVYSGPFDYSLENVILLDALRECLEIRLLQQLREQESAVYSPSVSVNSAKLPEGRYSFIVSFGCAPENVDKVVALTGEEIEKLRVTGPPLENVRKWRAEDRASRETRIKTNSFWLNYLQSQRETGSNLDEIENYDSAAGAVTPEALRAAAMRWLSGRDCIRLVLMPEEMRER